MGTSISDVAEQMGYGSNNAFSKAFKQQTGHLPTGRTSKSDALPAMIQRVERVTALMREGNHPLSETAILAGFKTVRSFGKAFKKVHGVSPTVWDKWRKRSVVITIR